LEENTIEFMKKWPIKFDIIVANPPYSKYRHIKFLDKCVDLYNDEIVFVHPATQYYTEALNKANDKIVGQVKDLTFFNGNGIFKIRLFLECVITHLENKQHEDFEVTQMTHGQNYRLKNLKDIHHLGNDPRIFSIRDGVKNKTKETFKGNVNIQLGVKGKIQGDPEKYLVEASQIQGHVKQYLVETTRVHGNIKQYLVETSRLQGGRNRFKLIDNEYLKSMKTSMQRKDFFIIFNLSGGKIRKSRIPRYDIFTWFETRNEAQNFIDYCKTDFARFILALYKSTQNISPPLNNIPWMDFTESWNDEKLYKHFNITEEEQTFIKEIIPKYYD